MPGHVLSRNLNKWSLGGIKKMKKFLAVAAVVTVVCCLSSQKAFARRGGSQRGGRGGQSMNAFGNNLRAQAMQQQQMQQQMRYRYRYGGNGGRNGLMQQSRFGTGNWSQISGQPTGSLNQNRWMYQQRIQNDARSGQAGNGARNGAAHRNMNRNQFRSR
jgi:hypothetical protein